MFLAAQTGIADTRATVDGLAPGRSYRIFVRAFDPTGNEVARSNAVNVTTSAARTTPTTGPTTLPRPSPTIEGQL